MRKLAEGELLSLTGLLKIEKDALSIFKAMQGLIDDEELKKQTESGILDAEGRIKGMEQFINENKITNTGEVQ